jgi:hypothetical protein
MASPMSVTVMIETLRLRLPASAVGRFHYVTMTLDGDRSKAVHFLPPNANAQARGAAAVAVRPPGGGSGVLSAFQCDLTFRVQNHARRQIQYALLEGGSGGVDAEVGACSVDLGSAPVGARQRVWLECFGGQGGLGGEAMGELLVGMELRPVA